LIYNPFDVKLVEPQHLAGMRDSGMVIAINMDSSTSIFEFADYGIAGNLFQILPQMIKEIKTRKMNRT